MIRPTIFLDLDDVLNTFTTSLFHKLGRTDLPHGDYKKLLELAPSSAHTFSLIDQANELFPDRNYDYESLWAACTEDMWATMPVSQEFSWLLAYCETIVGRQNIMVLTAPIVAKQHGSLAACLAGKDRWIRHMLPGWMHEQYLIGKAKAIACAGPHKLLIDDGSHNVQPWRQHGGAALEWPRPWNNAPEQTEKQIKDRLDKWVTYADAICTQLHVA